MYELRLGCEKPKPAMTKMGPNDARHVVWAIGTSFLFLMFLYTNYFYILTISILFRL